MERCAPLPRLLHGSFGPHGYFVFANHAYADRAKRHALDSRNIYYLRPMGAFIGGLSEEQSQAILDNLVFCSRIDHDEERICAKSQNAIPPSSGISLSGGWIGKGPALRASVTRPFRTT